MIRSICLAVAALLTTSVALMSSVTGAVAADADTGRLMLVLDSSGSMKEKSGGQTKIALAKQALGQVVNGLPAEQEVGLRVYGAKVFSAADDGACTDSQKVVDLGTGNRADLTAAIGKYKPYGETPTGYALQQAGKDLGAEGTRTIVLVSDGESTCDPDPCKAAAELANDGIDLRIDVVGLDVSGKAREQLQCIAGSGNGSYYDAADADDLVSALDTLATRAARPYETIGRPITGSQTPGDAPAITAGDWRDVLGGAGSPKRDLFYRLDDFDPTSTLHISATINQPAGDWDKINIDLVRAQDVDKKGVYCTRDVALELGTRQVGLLSPSVRWSYDAETSNTDKCSPDEMLLRVRRGWDWAFEKYEGGGNNDLPLEIRIIEEPAIDPDAPLPNRADDGVFQVPANTTDRTPLVGGSSFANAPTIAPGAYSGTVVPGETQIFLVDAGWGQSVQAQLTLPTLSGALEEEVGTAGPAVEAELYAPTRALATKLIPQDSDGETTNNTAWLGSPVSTTARAMLEPVRYNNRNRGLVGDSDVKNDSAAVLAGKYALVIHTEPDKRSGTSYQVPVTLDLAVIGEVTGAPVYVSEPKKIGKAAEPAAAQAESEKSESTASTKTDDDGLPLVPIGLGVVGAALLAGAVVVLRKARATA